MVCIRRKLVTGHPQSGNKEIWMLVFSSLSPFHSVQHYSYRMVLPTLRLGLPCQLNFCRYNQKCVSMETLNPARLTNED